MNNKNTFNIAILISGKGSILKTLLDSINKNELKANVSVLISSKIKAPGINVARSYSIPFKVIPYTKYKNNLKQYSSMITNTLKAYNPNLIILGGFLSPYFVPSIFKYKVINIHPSLIPKFSGKGYYGQKIHKEVKRANETETGCTIHYVNDEYDKGPIIKQIKCSISQDDSVEAIERKVKLLESKFLPTIINNYFINNY